MCKLVLDRGNFVDFTSVSNVFIDEYMPKANGEFIKIYLHLLRIVNGGNDALLDELSTEKIADKFNVLESDVMRALNYWSDQGLLSLSFNDKNELTGIRLESAVINRYIVKGFHHMDASENILSDEDTVSSVNMLAKASGESVSSPVPESSGIIVPQKKKYSAKEISAFAKDERVIELKLLAEQYLRKPLTPTDINHILYMLDKLSFDTEFITYIMETCIDSGRKSLSQIEKQAVEYAKKGISTIDEAKADAQLRRAIFKSIYKIFGLAPKAPVKKEISYVTKWTDEYGFTDEIILEACNRTMEHTHTGSFQYADTILTNWFKNSAMSLEAIEKLDNAHAEEVNKSFRPKTSSRTKKVKSFDQRTYDYDELERQLIANRDKRLKKHHVIDNNN